MSTGTTPIVNKNMYIDKSPKSMAISELTRLTGLTGLTGSEFVSGALGGMYIISPGRKEGPTGVHTAVVILAGVAFAVAILLFLKTRSTEASGVSDDYGPAPPTSCLLYSDETPTASARVPAPIVSHHGCSHPVAYGMR